MRDAGYQTLLPGKWHLGHRQRAYLPTARGFDHFYGHGTGGIGYWDHVSGGGLDWQRNGETLREEGYSTHLIADEAVRLIEGRDPDRPLFLFASFDAPHLPNEAPPEAIARYEAIENPFRRGHAAMVSEFDAAVGRIVDALQAADILDDALIWSMSDNGGLNPASVAAPQLQMVMQLEAWYGKPLPLRWLEFLRTNWLEGGADNGPFRLGKMSAYEGGTRVPALVYWQGRLQPGVAKAMVTVQDVLPTLLAVAGVDSGGVEFDGIDPGATRDLPPISWPRVPARAGGRCRRVPPRPRR